MDNSRLLIATLLCFALLVGWQYFSDFMGWTPPPAPIEEAAQALCDGITEVLAK